MRLSYPMCECFSMYTLTPKIPCGFWNSKVINSDIQPLCTNGGMDRPFSTFNYRILKLATTTIVRAKFHLLDVCEILTLMKIYQIENCQNSLRVSKIFLGVTVRCSISAQFSTQGIYMNVTNECKQFSCMGKI